MRSPHSEAMRRPAAVEPVKVILSMSGVADQKLGDVAVGRDDVEHAGRQADVLGDLGEEVGVAGRLRRGLEDDRAPGDQAPERSCRR